ncbi:O-antigen ligase family protein [Mycetocola sp. 2940]|uniref:O-antigen ligase family protein n=1 Tax=Mycetocola sp. 2940 TaxID=3156452 RepID=UPI0033952C66
MTLESRSPRHAASLHLAIGARREIDAVTMLTVYLVLLLAIPSGVTITALGTLGRPSLIWGLVLVVWWAVARLQTDADGVPGISQPVRFAFAAFVVVALLSFAAAMLRGQPDDQLSPAVTALIRLLSWAGVFLVAVDGIRTMSELSAMVRRIGIGAGLLAALGLLQVVTGQALVGFFGSVPGLSLAGGLGERAGVIRSSGTAIHPLEYATALNAALPLVIAVAVSLGFRRNPSSRDLWWWLPVGLISVSSLVAVSRSAIIGFVVAVISMLPAVPRRYLPATLGVGTIVAFAVFAASPGLLSTTIGLFTGIGDDPSTQSRTRGVELVPGFMSHSPLIGTGYGIFLPRYYIFDNQWVLLAVELGTLGILAFAGLFVAGIWSARRARFSADPGIRLLGHALAAAMFNVAVLFLFFDGLSFPIAGGMLFLLLGLCASIRAVAAGDGPGMPESAGTRPIPDRRDGRAPSEDFDRIGPPTP